MNRLRVLVTGASGFIGRAVCMEANTRGVTVRAVTRAPCGFGQGIENIIIGDIDENTNWSGVLAGCDVVVHLAARVHVMHDGAGDPLEEYRRINVRGTLNLAHKAAEAGVKRFLFVSTIKVNGEATATGIPFSADDIPAPQDAYGISKLEAEKGLLAISTETGMEVVIIRPPLVYGPGVKANFSVLMRWVQTGLPLPLGAIHNRRSLVALYNLVDLMIVCFTHPAANGHVFLVSDGEDVSTTGLLRRIAEVLGAKSRLVPIPVALLQAALALVGKKDMGKRLCGSLQVDMQKTCRVLNWNPPITLEEGLMKAVPEHE